MSSAPDPSVVVESRWRDLAVARGSAFMLPEWFETWTRHYDDRGSAAVVRATRDDGALCGVMPLVRRRRALRFAGAGLGDHFAPVAREEDEDAVAAAAVVELGRDGYLVLDHVEAGASWPGAIQRASERSLRRVASRSDVLPRIELEGVDWDGYLGSRTRNFRSQVRTKTRRLERDHDVTYRLTERSDELDRDMDTFFRLHDARWGPRGGSSLPSERSRSFHRDFAHALLEHGWLRLWFLELDGEPAACWYGWNLGGRYAYYLAGFEPRWEGESVGFVLLAHTIRAAIGEGAREYDLLRGDEEYKKRFATHRHQVETLVLAPAASPTRVAAWLEAEVWRRSSELPDGMRAVGKRAYRAVEALTPTGQTR